MTSCFVYKVIRDFRSIDHLCINPILSVMLIACLYIIIVEICFTQGKSELGTCINLLLVEESRND